MSTVDLITLELVQEYLVSTVREMRATMIMTAHSSIISALPNIYGEEQLTEFAAASDHAPLSDAEMERVHELYVRNFDIVPYAEEVPA